MPSQVSKEYKDLAEWHVKTFPPIVFRVAFKFLEAHRMKVYVAPRVLQRILDYFTIA
jgi:hypothetical protein